MDSLLKQIPKLYSFIVVRHESFGGYIFNPYLLDPLAMNEIGISIIELCDGSKNISEIITCLCNKYSLPFQILKSTVLDAIDTFNKYFAIKYIGTKLPNSQKVIRESMKKKNNKCLLAPLSVLWDITNECNLKCKHCLTNSGKKLENELNFEEVKKILDQLVHIKVFNVCFLGGEPLMRNDFLQILKYASNSNLGITFSTNGSLINKQLIKELNKLKIFKVQVSLDGLEKTHNWIRGINTSFQKAVIAIKLLVKAGFQVDISTTVNKININELDKVIELSILLGATSFKAIPFMPIGRGKNADRFNLSPNDMKRFVSDMNFIKKKYGNQINIFFEQTYSWLLESPSKIIKNIPIIKSLYCAAGTSQIVISSDGLVFPCPFLRDFIAGDLRKTRLVKIWRESKILAKFRNIEGNKLKGKCKNCEYIPLYCKGGCRAAAYNQTGDFFAEDPLCWYKNT